MTIEHVSVAFGDADFAVYRVFAQEPARSSVPILHDHPLYEFHLVRSGCYRFAVHDRRIEMQAGEMLLIRPGEPHYAFVPSAAAQVMGITLSLTRVAGAAGYYERFRAALDAHVLRPFPISQQLADEIATFMQRRDRTLKERCSAQLEAGSIVRCV